MILFSLDLLIDFVYYSLILFSSTTVQFVRRKVIIRAFFIVIIHYENFSSAFFLWVYNSCIFLWLYRSIFFIRFVWILQCVYHAQISVLPCFVIIQFVNSVCVNSWINKLVNSANFSSALFNLIDWGFGFVWILQCVCVFFIRFVTTKNGHFAGWNWRSII